MKPWLIALIGLGIAAIGFLADMMMLTTPAIRNGYWTFLVLIPAVCIGIFAISKERNWATIGITTVTVLVVGVYTFVRFLPTPTAPPLLSVNQDFPSFELKDQDDKEVTLRSLRSDGPVVVVLFRGGW